MEHIKTINEFWKDIQDYEGLYQVSNFGRVKSLTRLSKQKHTVTEKILKPTPQSNKYLDVTLCDMNGNKKHFY